MILFHLLCNVEDLLLHGLPQGSESEKCSTSESNQGRERVKVNLIILLFSRGQNLLGV